MGILGTRQIPTSLAFRVQTECRQSAECRVQSALSIVSGVAFGYLMIARYQVPKGRNVICKCKCV